MMNLTTGALLGLVGAIGVWWIYRHKSTSPQLSAAPTVREVVIFTNRPLI